jgi:hypothetical protein
MFEKRATWSFSEAKVTQILNSTDKWKRMKERKGEDVAIKLGAITGTANYY